MKKFKFLLVSGMIFACASLFGIGAYAANGDVIGKVYSTDILAKIDGHNAPSYNIGGKTAVVIEELADVESMRTYAVYAKYDDSARTLNVRMESSKNFWSEAYDEIKRGKVGKILGDVYETDIKVYINGYEIDGMNIGGKTAIAIEDLGKIGGVNENFGYSKYRCTAKWDAENKIIALDFIDPGLNFSVFDYGANLVYTASDNVISAKFDRMNYITSGFYSTPAYSDEFKKETNVLKPLYFDNGKEKTEIGFMYIFNDDYIPYEVVERYFITKPEILKELTYALWDGKTPTADEAFKALDDKENYETLDKLETEDFYFVTVKVLKPVDEYQDIVYVAVKKTGGYSNVYSGSSIYDKTTVEKVGENIVRVGLSPYAGPSGANKLNCDFDLNSYTIR